MFRPRIQAPILVKPRAAKSSSARRAAVTSVYLLKRSSGEAPLVQRHAADTERVGEVLMGASAVAIEGKGEALNPQFSHERHLSCE